MSEFPHFSKAVEALGETDEARGRALGMSWKTASRYRAGQIPDPVEKWVRAPNPQAARALLMALLADLEGRAASTT